MVALRVTLALLLLAGLSVLAGTATAGSLPPPEEKIVYMCSFDFILDICTMNADGSDEQRLTGQNGNDNFPELSPDGETIAWTQGDVDLWVMNADGSDQHLLKNFGAFVFAPTWSPDGSKLAFACTFQGQQGICTANSADGSDQELVAPVDEATQPDWSPDGTRIAFESKAGQDESDLYVVDLASGDVANLTNTPDLTEHFPRFSPDGSRIAFWSEFAPGDPVQRNAIYSMNDDGGNREQLFAPLFFTPVSSPAWSPDGTLVAAFCDQEVTPDREMCLIDAESGALVDEITQPMTHASEGWAEPDWVATGIRHGDVDCNGEITADDAAKVLARFEDLPTTNTPPCPDIGENVASLWGDVSCNDQIDPRDALIILRFIVGAPMDVQGDCGRVGALAYPLSEPGLQGD